MGNRMNGCDCQRFRNSAAIYHSVPDKKWTNYTIAIISNIGQGIIHINPDVEGLEGIKFCPFCGTKLQPPEAAS